MSDKERKDYLDMMKSEENDLRTKGAGAVPIKEAGGGMVRKYRYGGEVKGYRDGGMAAKVRSVRIVALLEAPARLLAAQSLQE